MLLGSVGSYPAKFMAGTLAPVGPRGPPLAPGPVGGYPDPESVARTLAPTLWSPVVPRNLLFRV